MARGARWAVCLAVLALAAVPACAEWPTEGGDSGPDIAVTTLADSGPGSLRAALSMGGRRHIVFKVGGEIFIRSPLTILAAHVTVAGETAPAPGISILGDKLRIRASDVILRDIRIRVGELPGSKPENRDGIGIDSGERGAGVENLLIDHCSVAWAIDEGVDIWGKVRNVRIRDSIIAETLWHSIHPKVTHSMGMLIGEGAQNVVIERNFFVSNMYRNPVIDAGASAVVVNNLIYNPGINAFHIYGKPDGGPTLVSVVGNVVVAGPDTHDFLRSFDHGVVRGSKIYFHDNEAIGTTAFSMEEKAGKQASASVPFVDRPPIWFDWINPLPADKVAETVAARAGARPDDRDATDKRLVGAFAERGGAIRDTPGDPRLTVKRPLPVPAQVKTR
jgi:hypothetical protein